MRKQKINTCSLCSERLQKRKGEEKNPNKGKSKQAKPDEHI